MPRNGKTNRTSSNTLSGESQAHSRQFLRLVPYEQDPLLTLARLLLERSLTPPVDLSQDVVLFPHSSIVPRFRQVLLNTAREYGVTALVPPYNGTLSGWLQRLLPNDGRLLAGSAREALLFEALNDHPQLCAKYGTWPLIDSLLALFDELSANHKLDTRDAQALARRLAEGYGITDPTLAPLGDEARLAYTLWQAWQQQLHSSNLVDEPHWLADGLARSIELLPPHGHIYAAGFVHFSQSEFSWLKALLARQRLTLVVHGQAGDHGDGYHPDSLVSTLLRELDLSPVPVEKPDAFSSALDEVFRHQGDDMRTRARRLAAARPESPLEGRVVIHEACDAEHEARAIDIQVRRWRLQGLHDIGIVTNDRRLARRVRALLERANVYLLDTAGWALSTTSAATVLMRWLECVEQDFAHAPLLDLLKSPFLALDEIANENTVLVFEQSVIKHHKLRRSLERYTKTVAESRVALNAVHGVETVSGIQALLHTLSQAASRLHPLLTGRPRRASDFLQAIFHALETLGIAGRYAEDAAGQQLLAELQQMHVGLAARPVTMHWRQFHTWLRRILEQRNFRPEMSGRDVELMGMPESRLYQFDAVIIAGATHEHLPGRIVDSPFFNDGVRRQLGLPEKREKRNVAFHDFRRLLEAAPAVMISLRREQDGEAIIPSPWVERLKAFHTLAYGAALSDRVLERLAHAPETQLAHHDASPMPGPAVRPGVRIPPSLVPTTISASAHQRLVDCPYQYYVHHCLRLKSPEEVREQLDKADYGQRVHQILQAFHEDVTHLPGPFAEAITADNRATAQASLTEITQAAFADDIKNDYLARGWLYRWLQSLPRYLDWQIQHARHWTPVAAECTREQTLGGGADEVKLTGRVDRLDQAPQGLAIIDYKTGAVPPLEMILAGEAVQLPFYSLLLDKPVQAARFLALDRNVSSKAGVEGETLATLATQVRQRLQRVQHAMRGGAGLPAWGDSITCGHCQVEGLCRRGLWREAPQKNGGLTAADVRMG